VCRKHIHYIEEPRCMRCGKSLDQEEEEYCRDCGREPGYYEQGYSLWAHRGAVSKAVYDFKYKNKRRYGEVFAAEMAAHFAESLSGWGIQEIIPIPLHRSRRRARGYNQAELLAEGLGRILDIPVQKQALFRVKKTVPQKSLDNKGRTANMRGAFALSGQYQPKASVLLVDDIYTTGSTINGAAKMLRKAGAEKVYFLTISIGQGL